MPTIKGALKAINRVKILKNRTLLFGYETICLISDMLIQSGRNRIVVINLVLPSRITNYQRSRHFVISLRLHICEDATTET